MIHPVILSGGLGTRLWPLSRAALPKQLLPLASERSMLQETALRVAGYPGIGAPVVVCNQEHRFLVAEQMHAIDMAPAALFLEPMGRNTAPAAAVAALHLARQDPEARMLLLHADHLIRDVSAFHASVAAADAAVDRGCLATFGIVPAAPETGYGYIQRGARIDGSDAFHVARFIEKPDLDTARVTRGEEICLVAENESTFIPLGTRHRLENPGKVPLEMIEVQSGSYLGEDDIVRFEDS